MPQFTTQAENEKISGFDAARFGLRLAEHIRHDDLGAFDDQLRALAEAQSADSMSLIFAQFGEFVRPDDFAAGGFVGHATQAVEASAGRELQDFKLAQELIRTMIAEGRWSEIGQALSELHKERVIKGDLLAELFR